MENVIKTLELFWQYPACTEREFYRQNKDNPLYIGLPWATILDKRVNMNVLIHEVIPYLHKSKEYFTCCQHIHYSKLIPLWKILGIKYVYISHKEKNKNDVNGIILLPCPLFAVNIETPQFNIEFQGIDILNANRPILYNFVGAFQNNYMSNIRPCIFTMNHPDNCIINNIGEWHLNKVVYSSKQNKNGELNIDIAHNEKTSFFNKLLLSSKYTLCPSGSGPNSIRLWEALGAGSIPVILSDTLELPKHDDWEKAIINVKETEFQKIPTILKNIKLSEELQRREKCLEIYKYFLNNYRNI